MFKSLFVTDLTDVETTDVEGVGTLRIDDSKMYRWVKYTGSTALAQGNVVCHDLTDAASMLEEVSVPATADLMLVAGVVMPSSVADSSSTTRYFWIQVYGEYSSVSVLPHTQAGGDWTNGQFGKGVDGQTYLTQDATTQPAYPRNIQILESPTTHTTPTQNVRSIAGFINCL